MPTRPLRLAVVLSHPTQYYSPWFRWIQAHAALELRVFYLWEFGVTPRRDPSFGVTFQWDVDLLSGYASEFVPNAARDPGTHHFRGLDNSELTRQLAAWGPDAILLFGYKWRSHLRAIFWARRHGVPLIFRGDSHFLGRPRPPWIRRLLLGALYRQFAAITFVGAANRDYFTSLRVPARRLFFAPHAVDQSLFDPLNPAHPREAQRLRSSLGLAPGNRVLLFAGKFIPAKQPVELLRAFLDLAPASAALVFVGDGEQRPALESLARRARPGTVHFLPFANQTEMPARYLLADVFVLPSRGLYETWGLAVNEAMHLGRPAVVSDRVGCQPDLITEDETGWVFHAEDPTDLRRALAKALGADLEAMRPRLAARIAGYTYAAATAGLLAALPPAPS